MKDLKQFLEQVKEGCYMVEYTDSDILLMYLIHTSDVYQGDHQPISEALFKIANGLEILPGYSWVSPESIGDLEIETAGFIQAVVNNRYASFMSFTELECNMLFTSIPYLEENFGTVPDALKKLIRVPGAKSVDALMSILGEMNADEFEYILLTALSMLINRTFIMAINFRETPYDRFLEVLAKHTSAECVSEVDSLYRRRKEVNKGDNLPVGDLYNFLLVACGVTISRPSLILGEVSEVNPPKTNES